MFHSSRQYHPSAPPPPRTSETIRMELSPSVISNNNNNNKSSLLYTPPSQTSTPQTPNSNNNQWRHKLNNLKQSFQNVGTPRFHRRPKVLRKFIILRQKSQLSYICIFFL